MDFVDPIIRLLVLVGGAALIGGGLVACLFAIGGAAYDVFGSRGDE